MEVGDGHFQHLINKKNGSCIQQYKPLNLNFSSTAHQKLKDDTENVYLKLHTFPLRFLR